MSRPANIRHTLVAAGGAAALAALAVSGALAGSNVAAAEAPNTAASDAAAARAAAAAAARSDLEPDFSQRDVEFAQRALQAGLAIIARGSLAMEQSGSAAVRRFGARMVDDHGRSNAELLRLARQRGLDLSARLGPAQHAMVQRMAALRGDAFDRAYLTWTIETHRHRIAEHREQTRAGEDAALKAWALRTIEMLQRHLAAAEADHAVLVGLRR